MSLARLKAAATGHHLAVFGLCHTTVDDDMGAGTLALLGPDEPGFWSHLTRQPEMTDGMPDPVDRWSRRVITTLAEACSGRALFPFGDPPRPFIGWALRSRRAWVSPVGMLVHDQAGLMVSYRGAILLDEVIDLPAADASPCDNCADRPCLSACPVGALDKDGYDLNACHTFLDTADGSACMTAGCAVRQSCPVSASYGRQPAQSGYHMRQFHKG